MPPGERKSGIPHSAEMPAPVKGRITEASFTRSVACERRFRNLPRSCYLTRERDTARCWLCLLARRSAGSGHCAHPAHGPARTVGSFRGSCIDRKGSP
jgi:hypothetical protein